MPKVNAFITLPVEVAQLIKEMSNTGSLSFAEVCADIIVKWVEEFARDDDRTSLLDEFIYCRSLDEDFDDEY